MAYFEQRKNGWMAQIRRRGMPTLSRTFDLKADAEAWAREIEREAQRGNVAVLRQDAQRVTVAEVMDRYLAGPVQAMKSAKDVRARLGKARERFGAHYLSNVRGVDVSGWRDDLLQEGLAPQTVIHHINVLSALFSFVEKDLSIDLPAGNPASKVRKPAAPPARDRRLRAGEVDALLAAAAQARAVGLRQIIILAVETSMRLGELLGLEWSRIDLARRTAHLVDTKNGSARTVALSTAALDALHSLPRRLDGRVFGWQAKDSFEKTWQRCIVRAKAAYAEECAKSGKKPDPAFLADLRFHDLRHEAASRLFEKGLGVMEVASMTGHKSLSMLKRYTHIEAEKLAKKLG
ncbi:putative Site-specific recombinase, phage integrase family [Thiomonas arsenitoxydans]|jgi:integrase|uniref:Site-specific recombinase, phage integrase family n=2 Tax=Burkholderiales genera incertae sedis TaxID=224471 RepID=A0ABM9SZF8_THIA3|nr:site-specific integrase [Thiomonas sp. CB2]OYV33932.1 MAG: integrase [Thiomonas sp. 20-64-5]OZB70570.1 MAG: integrase [Thiomonas sp. 13-64-67]CQR26464.1 putative Site-specific recombinase, phage integrase family [Thiomonas arsenitoxydans]CQR44182.1 putative Site-specific recombinase, phage integrase family [Thiomonas sp. CB3]VDY03273.1 putative Site-specific recombinase, phage integrase family [Thiomonas sp. Bio17B3]VDY09552.1 putative Site-specific recombinase, phage integrase family [Thi